MIIDSKIKKIRMLKDFFLSYFVDNYSYDYWHFPHLLSNRIDEGDYFIDFRPKADYPGPLDSNNIPLLDLRSQHSAMRSGIVYNPIVISQYGLAWDSIYLRNKEKASLEKVLHIADWLVTNSVALELENMEL